MNTFRRSAVVLLVACFDLGIACASPAPHNQATSTQASQTSDSGQGQKQGQLQSDPLAEAAKRAKEEKKKQPKTAKTWDNDNIPTTPGDISVVGESGTLKEASATPAAGKTETPAAADQGAPDAGAKSSAEQGSETGTNEDRKAELTKQLEQAKEKLGSVSTDLDILTRKYALDQQTYYSKPDHASDTEGAVALKVEEGEIATKKQEVADAQKRVDDITAKLKELEDESKPKS